jgi:xanthine/uracil permease
VIYGLIVQYYVQDPRHGSEPIARTVLGRILGGALLLFFASFATDVVLVGIFAPLLAGLVLLAIGSDGRFSGVTRPVDG